MFVLQSTSPLKQREGTCSDCGRATDGRISVYDQGTHSRVTLCNTCAAAFRQRQQFLSGCCGEL